MKKILLLSFIFCSLISKAQSWCPPGAVWHYKYIWFTETGYDRFINTGETVINNTTCIKLKVEEWQNYGGNIYHHDLPPVYTYESGDTVYFSDGGAFKAYYYFGAHVGDTIKVGDRYSVVDSTGTTTVNNQSLRVYRYNILDTCNGSYGYGKKKVAVEHLGVLNHFLISEFSPCGSDERYYKIGCYQDSSFALYQSDTVSTCDYLDVGIHEIDTKIRIEISPNPADDICYITVDEGQSIKAIEVFDVTGKKLMHPTISFGGSSFTLQTSILPKGLYLVKITFSNGNISIGKLTH